MVQRLSCAQVPSMHKTLDDSPSTVGKREGEGRGNRREGNGRGKKMEGKEAQTAWKIV